MCENMLVKSRQWNTELMGPRLDTLEYLTLFISYRLVLVTCYPTI